MSESYVSVRIEPLNSRGYSAQIAHDYRTKVPNYIDQSKTHLNVNTKKPRTLAERLEVHEKETGRTVRKDARIAYSGIITFSTEAQETIKALDVERQKELYAEVAKSISKQLDVDLMYLSIHNDETSPHCHFMFKPYTKTDRKSLRLNPKDLSRLQDTAGDAIFKLGYDISRGKKKSVRVKDAIKNNEIANIKHRNVRELHKTYKADMDVKAQKTSLKKQLKEVRNAYFNFENDEDELPCNKADHPAQEQATCNFDPVAQEKARQVFKASQQQKKSEPMSTPVVTQEKPDEKKHEYLKLRPI